MESHRTTFRSRTLVQLICIPLAVVIGFTSSFEHKVRETRKRHLISTEGFAGASTGLVLADEK